MWQQRSVMGVFGKSWELPALVSCWSQRVQGTAHSNEVRHQARLNSSAQGFLAEMMLPTEPSWRLAKVRRFSKQETLKKLSLC